MELLQASRQHCPWCGEPLELSVDCSAGDHTYVEDCQVCCAPMVVTVRLAPEPWMPPRVDVRREGD